MARMEVLTDFFNRQMEVWPETAARYEALKHVLTKELGGGLIAQHNPERIRSTAAKIDVASLAERPCFLCRHNRPKEQIVMPFLGGKYELLVNPYPILPMHFTIVAAEHRPQTAAGIIADIRALIGLFPELTVFYNGPHCGASAPDHAHLQAGTSGLLPIQRLWGHLDGYPATIINIEPDEEPDVPNDVNIVAWEDRMVVFPRSKHRPSCYPSPMISPGALDMAGLIITPRLEDYEGLSYESAAAILTEVSIPPQP